METVVVYINSTISNIIAEIPFSELSELKQLAKRKTVLLEFKHDYCRITAERSRKVKVPQKALASSDGLAKWIKERINSAWK